MPYGGFLILQGSGNRGSFLVFQGSGNHKKDRILRRSPKVIDLRKPQETIDFSGGFLIFQDSGNHTKRGGFLIPQGSGNRGFRRETIDFSGCFLCIGWTNTVRQNAPDANRTQLMKRFSGERLRKPRKTMNFSGGFLIFQGTGNRTKRGGFLIPQGSDNRTKRSTSQAIS